MPIPAFFFNVGYKTLMSNVRIETNLKLGCQILMLNFGGDITPYCYINTKEIPSELSRENISSHVKRSVLLWLHINIAPFDAFCEMI